MAIPAGVNPDHGSILILKIKVLACPITSLHIENSFSQAAFTLEDHTERFPVQKSHELLQTALHNIAMPHIRIGI